ncbi:hypothetical protein VHUM_03495 [Vanrija humicola]|uniref:Fe2OG dioxygenase domain-containing protein n=1 Tax=Vanrija humicola TaxID=5417 RepID=A0A7D8YWT4_VANHU|nr:hypothetical protein VHUM_03495 [Vanrija humicola]
MALPPFPSDVKTAPLVSLSLARLQAGDEAESAAFFACSKALGFFYLEMAGSDVGEAMVREADALNELQKQWMALPNETKEQYGLNMDKFFAYRHYVLPDGQRKEDYNVGGGVGVIRKDDVLGIVTPRLPAHQLILDAQPLFESYVRHCRVVIDLLLELLTHHLKLPAGTLAKLHRASERSGDHVRFNHSPPTEWDEESVRKGEHTDYGSLTILFNWLGGLQIRPPDSTEWVWVRPVPGSCIVNLGDAMVTFTAGILRSNIHRVAPAPPPQDTFDRYSLVYFTRPEDDVVMRRLKGGIIDAQETAPAAVSTPEMTAAEWWLKRGSGVLPGIFTAKGFETAPVTATAS